MRILKLALRPWRLSPMNQFLGAISVGILLTLGGALFTIYLGLGPAITRLKSEQVLSVYASAKVVTRDQEKELVDSVKVAIGSATVTEIEWVGTDAFLERIRGESPSLVNELQALGPERNSIVPRYVSISGRFGEDELARLKSVPGVESVDSSRDRHLGVIGAFAALRWISIVLLGGLAIALLTGLGHLGRLNRSIQADVLALLHSLGAGSDLLLGPLVLGGASVGLVGGLFAFTAWSVIVPFFFRGIQELSPGLMGIVAPASWIGFFLILAGTFLGAVSGGLSARARTHG